MPGDPLHVDPMHRALTKLTLFQLFQAVWMPASSTLAPGRSPDQGTSVKTPNWQGVSQGIDGGPHAWLRIRA